MEHFVRIIFEKNTTEKLDESVFPTQNLLETTDGRSVIEIPLSAALNEQQSDDFADKLTEYMLSLGHDTFDIEISTDEDI